MGSLVVCAGCARHVRADEAACPFCGAAVLSPRACSGACFGPPALRLSRAALVVAGAAFISACETATTFPPYGLPPHIDAGDRTVDASSDSPSDATPTKGKDGAPDSDGPNGGRDAAK